MLVNVDVFSIFEKSIRLNLKKLTFFPLYVNFLGANKKK